MNTLTWFSADIRLIRVIDGKHTMRRKKKKKNPVSLLSPFLFFILHNTWFSVDIRVIRVIGGKHTIRGLVQSSELYVLLAGNTQYVV